MKNITKVILSALICASLAAAMTLTAAQRPPE